MALNMNDQNELLEILGMFSLEEFNLTDPESNVSRVEAMVCLSAASQHALLYALSILYIFIFIIGLSANALVVWVNLRAERSRYETHLYVLNLAVADLCVVATLPVSVSSLLQHGHWPFGGVICKLTHLIFSVNLFSSIFFLACMSVDRYLTVAHFCDSSAASQGRKRRIRRLICAGVWLLALAAALPETYFLQAVKSSHTDTVVCEPVYPIDTQREWRVGVNLSFITLGFAVPFPVIAVFYVLLVRAVPALADQERSVSRRLVFTYIVVFLVCWLPYHGALLLDVLAFLGIVPYSCGLQSALLLSLHLTQCLSLLHCCVNPVVYNFINRNYRYDLMKAFIFKYSTKTGLARLIDGSRVSETEYSAVEGHGVM